MAPCRAQGIRLQECEAVCDRWTIVEDGFDPATSRAYEGFFTLGSGYLHVRGSLEEHLADCRQNVEYDRRPSNTTAERFPETRLRWGTFVPGVVGPHPWLIREMVNLPWFLDLAPTVAGERLDVTQSQVKDHRRELDLRRAVLSRRLTWRPAGGPAVEVVFERFVSGARPHLSVQRMTLTAEAETRATVRGGIDSDVRTNGYDHLVERDLWAEGAAGVLCRVRTNGGDVVRTVARLSAAGAAWQYAAGELRAARVAELTLRPGEPLVVEKRTAVTTSRDLDEADAARVLDEAAALPYEDLLAEHAGVWEARWDASDVVIEGDAESQLAIRAAVYHLLRALVRGDPRVAIGAKGFAGEAYRGHFFWDTEMYMLPFYLYTAPASARSLVDFRVQTLAGARRLARRYGCRGARYAWMSDTEGQECCPHWQIADHQVHVTAAAVYGLAHWARAAGDAAYLEGPAAEAIVETARYWLDRMDTRSGEYHPSLLGVMGPDEYTLYASNNAYTNRMAAFALRLAAETGPAGGATDEQRRAFAEAATGLPLARRADGLVLQCEEFERLAEPDFEHVWTDRSQPVARFVPQERLYRTKCPKQADVLLLMMLFPGEFTDAEVRAAWDYYVPYTTHDSSLSASVHAIVACRLGLEEAAWAFWRASAGRDLDTAHGGAAEGVHIAAAGGNWMTVVLGFAGMRTAMQADVLTFRPRLPKAWTRLAFPVVWKGTPVFVDATPDGTTVTNRGEAPLEVRVGEETRTIGPGDAATF